MKEQRYRVLFGPHSEKIDCFTSWQSQESFIFFCFAMLPMLGISIAFMDYNVYQGFGGSTWVGLQNFTDLFSMYGFQEAFRNTLIISFAKIIFGFPVPILFAILLNEVTHSVYKKTVQTVVCLPNFISWIVVQGLLYALFSPSTGALQSLLNYFGYQGQTVNLLASKEYFQGLIVVSDIWKTFGYNEKTVDETWSYFAFVRIAYRQFFRLRGSTNLIFRSIRSVIGGF